MFCIVEQRRYRFHNFLLDCVMSFLTWGLWLIWIFVREMRQNRQLRCF